MNDRTPLEAIRAKCIQCADGAERVAWCYMKTCPLYEWRNGYHEDPPARGRDTAGTYQLTTTL